MRTVLLDTVGIIALWEETDQWHGAAEQAMAALGAAPTRLITTSIILLECGNAASRKPYRADVPLLRRKLIDDGRLIIPTESDVEKAWNDYLRGNAGDAGVVDHISFVVMRRLGVTDAFTNDRHFKAAGFNTLF